MPHNMIWKNLTRTAGGLLAVATCFAFLAVSPLTAAGLYDAEHFKLANGMEVVVISDHRAAVVTHMIWYKVGAADEPPGKSGLAHYLEHLMFKGTATVAPGEFSKVVARNGGRENAFTSYDFTGYYQTVASDRLEIVMRLEADRMRNLVLDAEAIEAERQVVLEERRSRTDNDPEAQFAEQLSAAQYLNHPYGTPVIGWEHEIRGLTVEDLRAFYNHHYGPNNAILTVAGDVTPQDVRRLVEKYYGGIAPIDRPARMRPREPPQISARRLEYSNQRIARPSFRRTYLAPTASSGKSEHALPLVLLSEILGGGSTSRLYRSLVVERKIAASSGSYYSASGLDYSQFYVYASPSEGHSLDEVETAVDAVIADVIENGVDAEALKRAKTGFIASTIYARDSVRSAAQIYGRELTTGRSVEDVKSFPERVEKVTAEEIRNAARYVFDLRRSVTGRSSPEPRS
ncbi:MAG: pitrilysin family protein [Proteobacteria bacterium]|nr:pitrilysin family protein [Pseudomonadota bacterium]